MDKDNNENNDTEKLDIDLRRQRLIARGRFGILAALIIALALMSMSFLVVN